jgi:hypothetical protein
MERASAPGHNMICTDWEMGESCRHWRHKYGDDWEARFRERYETEMIEKNDTYFYVGEPHQFPNAWIVVGLFYPPTKPQETCSSIERGRQLRRPYLT